MKVIISCFEKIQTESTHTSSSTYAVSIFMLIGQFAGLESKMLQLLNVSLEFLGFLKKAELESNQSKNIDVQLLSTTETPT